MALTISTIRSAHIFSAYLRNVSTPSPGVHIHALWGQAVSNASHGSLTDTMIQSLDEYGGLPTRGLAAETR